MNRRIFLAKSSILLSLLLGANLFANSANEITQNSSTHNFNITNSYEVKYENEDTNLWIPLALSSSYQSVSNLKYTGNFDTAQVVDNPYDTKVLHVKWNKQNKQKRELKLTFTVLTKDRNTNFKHATNKMQYPKDVQVFLQPTTHIPIDENIKKFLNPIIKNANTPLQKAKAIYEWTATNMHRDPDTIGCGLGDAKRAIEQKLFGGKCTDISSVFIALLRNANIPAREVFGIRVGKSNIAKSFGGADEKGFANITGSQHCRSEFYLDGIGWVPADPADVTKLRLAENLENENERVKKVKEFLFGSWEMNWIAFNYARDFTLNPKPAQFPLNMLGYPYGENGEDVLNYYDPTSFSYTYTSQKI